MRDYPYLKNGVVVSGIHALAYHNSWAAENDNVIYLENNSRYEDFIPEQEPGYIWCPESPKEDIVDGYACWQKALLDIICYRYDEYAADGPIYEEMTKEDAVEWCEWMDKHPGYWDRAKTEPESTRWVNHLLYLAGRSDIDEDVD